jgi:hypothetical protein
VPHTEAVHALIVLARALLSLADVRSERSLVPLPSVCRAGSADEDVGSCWCPRLEAGEKGVMEVRFSYVGWWDFEDSVVISSSHGVERAAEEVARTVVACTEGMVHLVTTRFGSSDPGWVPPKHAVHVEYRGAKAAIAHEEYGGGAMIAYASAILGRKPQRDVALLGGVNPHACLVPVDPSRPITADTVRACAKAGVSRLIVSPDSKVDDAAKQAVRGFVIERQYSKRNVILPLFSRELVVSRVGC